MEAPLSNGDVCLSRRPPASPRAKVSSASNTRTAWSERDGAREREEEREGRGREKAMVPRKRPEVTAVRLE